MRRAPSALLLYTDTIDSNHNFALFEVRKQHVPFSAVEVGGDVGRHVVSVFGAVHGRVESVDRLKHVESTRVGVEQLANERRAAALVR